MKKTLALGILMIAAIAAFWFFGRGDLSDQEQGQFETTLWRIKQLDTTFKENLLETRFSVLNTYDDFEANRRETEQTLAAMKAAPGSVTVEGEAALVAWIASYEELLQTRQHLVEHFKSQNAVVTNSRRYLPLAVEELVRHLGDSKADRELATVVNQVDRTVMAGLSSRQTMPGASPDGRTPLQDWVTRHPGDPEVDLATSLDRHARILVSRSPELDALIDQILSVPTSASIEALSRIYQSEVSIALGHEQQYRTAFYLLCALLMATGIYGFHALRVANGLLERRVEERTADLSGSEQRFRTLAAAAPIGIFLTNPRGDVIFTNPHWQDIAGLGPEECLGDGWHRALHPDDAGEVGADWALMLGDGRQRDREFRFVTAGGETRWVHARVVAVQSQQGAILGFTGTVENITPRKMADAALEKAHRELIDISHQAGMAEVATSVLHNVGNVLNSVNVSAALAIQQIKEGKVVAMVKAVALLREHEADLGAFFTNDARARPLATFLCRLSERLLEEQAGAIQELEALRDNVDHIKQIVGMQQSFAKVSGLKEFLEVRELVDSSLQMNVDGLQRHGVEVVRDFADVPAVEVEKHKVLQILVNLVCNAKIACTESGRTDKRVTVRIFGAGGRTQISVSDNGIGIAPENLTRIFGHGFTTRKDGHGFGLHSGALAAREISGSLTAHSDGPGLGATFTLALPLPSLAVAA